MEGLETGLRLLEAHGFIRKNELEAFVGRPGRKPSQKYEVNPYLKKKLSSPSLLREPNEPVSHNYANCVNISRGTTDLETSDNDCLYYDSAQEVECDAGGSTSDDTQALETAAEHENVHWEQYHTDYSQNSHNNHALEEEIDDYADQDTNIIEEHVSIVGSAPDGDFTIIDTVEAAESAIGEILGAPTMFLATKTTGLDVIRDHICLVQVLVHGKVPYVFDCRRIDPRVLERLIANSPTIVGHNLKYVISMLVGAGIASPDGSRLFDTQIATLLLSAGTDDGHLERSSLEQVAARYLRVQRDKALQTSRWDGELSGEQWRYAASDVVVLEPLYEHLRGQLEKWNIDRTMALEMNALPVVAWTERSGVLINTDQWLSNATKADEERNLAEVKLNQMMMADGTIGKEKNSVNWNSADQVKKILLARGNPVGKSIDDVTLRTLARSDPLADLLLQYRDANKLSTTYGERYLTKYLNPVTGRVHAHYAQIGAATGRMSCSSPNLQQIPKLSDYRKCIIPAEENRLIKADLSLVELGVCADLSGDEAMIRAFAEGKDLHRLTAAAIYQKAPEDATKEERAFGKTVNFGSAYGQGVTGLIKAAAKRGITLSESSARDVKQRFAGQWPQLAAWCQDHMSDCGLEIRTTTGRVRHVDLLTSGTIRVNTPIQGTAADGYKCALGHLWETRDRCPSAKPILLVHDEVVVECKVEEAEQAREWLVQGLERGMQDVLIRVPIRVEATIGTSWAMEE